MAEGARAYKEYPWKSDVSFGINVVYSSLRRLIDPSRNRTVLDLGCGNGSLARKLTEDGFDVYGVDASVSGVERANKHQPGRFFVTDIGEVSLPEALRGVDFDTVVSTEVIEHLYDPHTLLRFARMVLDGKPQAQLVLTTPYHGYLKNLIIALADAFDEHVDPKTTGGHIKFWSRKTMTEALVDAGFSVESFLGAGRFPYCWKSMVLDCRIAARPTPNSAG